MAIRQGKQRQAVYRDAAYRAARLRELAPRGGAAAAYPDELVVKATTIATPVWGINGADAGASSWPTAYGTADDFNVRTGSSAAFGESMGAGITSPYDVAVDLNGDYYGAPADQPEMHPQGDDFWCEALVETPGLTSDRWMFAALSGSARWDFLFTSPGRLRAYIYDAGGTGVVTDFGTGAWSANTVYWFCIIGNRSESTGFQAICPQIDDTAPLGRGLVTTGFDAVGTVSPASIPYVGSKGGSGSYTEKIAMLRMYRQSGLYDDTTWLTDCLDAAKIRAAAIGVY